MSCEFFSSARKPLQPDSPRARCVSSLCFPGGWPKNRLRADVLKIICSVELNGVSQTSLLQSAFPVLPKKALIPVSDSSKEGTTVSRATVLDVSQKGKQERKQARKRRGPAWLSLGVEPVPKACPAEWGRRSALSTVRGTPA